MPIKHDLRFALRLLRRAPGHAAVTVVTMSLAIAAATVLFSIADGVIFKPLPWPEADRLVRLTESRQGSTRRLRPMMTNLTYRAWRDHSTALESMAAVSPRTVTLTDAGDSERIVIAAASATLFPLLRAQPILGTTFTTADEVVTSGAPIVLSYGLWQQRFGGDRSIVGRTIKLDGDTYRVTGVMPAGFEYPDQEVRGWVPFNVPPFIGADAKTRTLSLFSAIARLKPGVTPAQAAAEARSLAATMADTSVVSVAVFGSKGPVEISVVPLADALTAEVRPALLLFLAAVGLLVITAVANIASVQLARATGRRREMAIRTALGAQGWALTRQLLVENAALGVSAGVIGLGSAALVVRALPALLPPDFPRVEAIAVDARVAFFALAVSVAASISFGLFPAVLVRRVDVQQALAEDGLAPVGGGGRSRTARARAIIMAGQVAIACVLLVGAALLTRSFIALMRADRGYDATNVLTARLPMPDGTYSPERRSTVVTTVLDRLRRVPGVTHAGITTVLPLSPGETLAAFPMPSPRGEGMVTVQAAIRFVSADYFAALGIRVVQGRAFTANDGPTAPVAIVNQAFARKYLGDTPLGTTLPGRTPPRTIVGIVEDVHQRDVTDPPQPELYQLYQDQQGGGRLYDEPMLVMRTADDPKKLIPALKSIISAEDRSLALESVMTMEDRVATSLARPRLYAVLLASFGAFALLIAGVGLFGVLAYAVAQRAREIGVRSALGATPRRIVGLVVTQGLVITGAGLAVGLGASFVVVSYLSSFLYGVSVHDPISFIVVPCVLAAVAALACAVPARRAARVDPLRALRAG